MKPQRLLKKLILLTVISGAHIVVSGLLYDINPLITIILIITALANSWVLLRYFSYTIQYILAHRIDNRDIRLRFVINIILGIVVNALLIYGLFVMIIAHTARITGLV